MYCLSAGFCLGVEKKNNWNNSGLTNILNKNPWIKYLYILVHDLSVFILVKNKQDRNIGIALPEVFRQVLFVEN